MSSKKYIAGPISTVLLAMFIIGILIIIHNFFKSNYINRINQTKPILFNASDYEIKINNTLINLNDYNNLPEAQQVIINEKIRAIELTDKKDI